MVPAEVVPSPQLMVALKSLASSTPLACVKVATWKLVSVWDFVVFAPETLIAGSANAVVALAVLLTVLESGETVARGKPAPDIFLKAASELGIDPTRCLVIEDAVAGVQAAHAAGMRCIAVAGNRDLPGLRQAELMVKDLTEVDVERVREL